MPLSVDNIIQSNTGGFDGTSGNATLPVGTAAGSTVLIFATNATGGTGSPSYQLTASGFTQVTGLQGADGTRKVAPRVFAKKNVSAGETSWALSLSPSGQQVAWVALEVTGIGVDPLNEWFVEPGLGNVEYQSGNVTTVTSRSTVQSGCYDVLVFALHAARSNDTTVPTFSGQTNGFTELVESSQVNATNAVGMAVSYAPSLVLSTFESTATLSPASPASATIVAFYADGAKFAPNIDVMSGAEFGTATSITNGAGSVGGNGAAPFNTAVGSPAVVTTNPRSGTYCFELSAAAATESLDWTAAGSLAIFAPTTGYPIVERLHVYFPTSLPSGDVELASVEAGSLANGVTVWYRTASQKIGVKIGTGAEQLSDATVAANTWVGIDLRYDPRTTTHLCDWQVDYDSLDGTGPVTQTQASTSGMTAADVSTVRIGWTSARTATVRYDDIVVSKSWGTYPLGDLRILPLGPDPAGTPAVVGTEANFKVYTSNGTMGTWNAANARGALDEIPPVVGASSDGIAQVTNDTNSYAQVPLDSFTAAPTNVLRALRWYVALWAASGTAAQLEIRSHDGAAETLIAVNADHGQDSSALLWACHMQRDQSDSTFYQLTQAKLDAMVLRMGWSADAAPDIGIHNVLAEVAYQPATVIQIMSGEGDAFKVFVRQDPVSAAVASYLLDTTAADRGATLTWTINTVDGSQHIGAGTTYEKVIGAVDVAGVTAVGMIVDPTV